MIITIIPANQVICWISKMCDMYRSSSVQLLRCVQVFVTLWTIARQDSPSIINSVRLKHSCPLSWWCHPTISSSVIPFSSCFQSFPASGSFLMSQLFVLGGQNIGASASVLPRNIQNWFPLELTGWISLKSKGCSRVFSNTTVQTHQFFGVHSPTLTSIHDHRKNHSLD